MCGHTVLMCHVGCVCTYVRAHVGYVPYVLCEQARELVLMAGLLPPHRLADQRKAVWTVPVVAKGDAGETARTQLTTVLCVAPAEYTKP